MIDHRARAAAALCRPSSWRYKKRAITCSTIFSATCQSKPKHRLLSPRRQLRPRRCLPPRWPPRMATLQRPCHCRSGRLIAPVPVSSAHARQPALLQAQPPRAAMHVEHISSVCRAMPAHVCLVRILHIMKAHCHTCPCLLCMGRPARTCLRQCLQWYHPHLPCTSHPRSLIHRPHRSPLRLRCCPSRPPLWMHPPRMQPLLLLLPCLRQPWPCPPWKTRCGALAAVL